MILLHNLFFPGTLCSTTPNKNTKNETEVFSKVRYMLVPGDNEVQTYRPLFYWDKSTPATTNLTQKPPMNSHNVTKSNNETIVINDNLSKNLTGIKRNKKNKKRKGKRRRKQKKGNRKNKKNRVLEIPEIAKNINETSYWKLGNSSSLKDLITKLNNNPETPPKELLGRNQLKKSKNGAVNMTNTNVLTRVNSKTLLEAGEDRSEIGTNEISFYDSFILVDTTAPTTTQSIFKVNFNERGNKVFGVNNEVILDS